MHIRLTAAVKLMLCVACTWPLAVDGYGQTASPQPASGQPVQAPAMPDWQRAAGGTQQFDVVSVRPDSAGKFVIPDFSMDADDAFKPTGGLFTADLPLTWYVSFAYKLPLLHSMLSGLPSWASKDHFAIQARATGDPSKDQLRLMMQSLLADRFKLAIHFETQVTPVLVMTLVKPGELGERLRLHADGPPCSVVAPHPAHAPVTLEMLPCSTILGQNEPDNAMLVHARNTTVQLMAAFFSSIGHMRPIVDRTGIGGNIDFSMEYTQDTPGAAAAAPDAQADLPGTTFLEAVKNQLGLKLEPAKAPLEIPVIDHVERPSEN
jgi:bla regulator protein BlaR1